VSEDLMFQAEIREVVRAAYRAIPTGAGRAMAERFYSDAELASVPAEAVDWALGVANPVRHAGLNRGEVVLDVGAGGGIDTVLAARRVGPGGRVVGLDMLAQMCERARAAVEAAGVAAWCELLQGELEGIPLPDASVDVVISNGALNLSPRKSRVFAEIARVLRPGGRVCVADLVVDDDLPPEILASGTAWAGCIAGAISERVLVRKLERAGLVDIEMSERTPLTVDDMALYPLFTADVVDLMRRVLPVEAQRHVATSLIARARKPAAAGDRTRTVEAAPAAIVRHLDDVAPTAVTDGVTVRLIKQVEDVDLKVVDYEAGRATPMHAHRHVHQGVIIAGRGAIELEGRRVTLTPWDVFTIPPNQAHAIHNDGPEPLRLVCMDCLVDRSP
jgi:SAM-dependent methyltransferase/quercetin dioxygenase-like cupin family protein